MALLTLFMGVGVKMTPGINPIYAGLERSCPEDFKNLSYIDVNTCIDLIKSCGWWGGGWLDSVRT